MLPLRLLRGAPPRRLVASTRPAHVATGSLLLGETHVRSCSRLQLTECQRGRPGSEFCPGGVGARHFSSRGDSDGDGSSLRDASSSQQRHEPISEMGSHSTTATTDTDNGLEEDPNSSNSSSDTNHETYVLKESVRVHPLSQLVLLFFQTDEGYDWISSRGILPSSLAFKGDGTFALTFPSGAISNSEAEESQRSPRGGESIAETDSKEEGSCSLPLATPPPPKCQIWTKYDEAQRKHWLCVSVRGKASRFLLQDYSSSAAKARRKEEEHNDDRGAPRYTPWRVGIHGHPKPTLADRVEDAVRAAMREVDQAMLAA